MVIIKRIRPLLILALSGLLALGGCSYLGKRSKEVGLEIVVADPPTQSLLIEKEKSEEKKEKEENPLEGLAKKEGGWLSLPENLNELVIPESVQTWVRDVIGVVDLEALWENHSLQKKIETLAKQIDYYQQIWFSRQDDLNYLEEEAQKHYDSLQEQINAQLQHIFDNYQEKIDEYIQELQEDLLAYEQVIWEESFDDVENYNTELQSLAEEEVKDYYDKMKIRFNSYKQEVRQRYAHQIFNLRLRLEMTYVTEEEQGEILKELEDLLDKENQLLSEKEAQLDEEFEIFLKIKEDELAQKSQLYQEEKQKELESLLAEKQDALDKKATSFISLMEVEMERVMQERQKKLMDLAEEALVVRQEEMQKELEGQWQSLQDKIEDAYDEIEEIEETIRKDIMLAIEEIAQEKNIDVVLTEVHLNVSGIDITAEALSKL